MEFQRSSGVLLHVSSLPSYGGIGDLGPAAHEFVAFLAAAKQHIWQVLPLCPTGYGNSPYAGTSAFAGNPVLISLEFLADWGWIAGERIGGSGRTSGNVRLRRSGERASSRCSTRPQAIFSTARPERSRRSSPSSGRQFEEFCRAEAAWLNDYALYAVLRRQFNTGAWTEWPEPLRRRDPQALAQTAAEHGRALAAGAGAAVCLFAAVESTPRGRGEAARSAFWATWPSSSTWIRRMSGCIRRLFELDEELKPIRIAGVPPDYFSPTGQRWGNPLYRWDVLAETRLRLVDRAHPPRARALRHRAARSLPRLRGLLGDSRRRRNGRSTASGSRRRAWSCSARSKRRSGRCRWWPKTWG